MRRVKVTLTIGEDARDIAKQMGFNMSRLLEAAIDRAITEYLRD